MTSALQTLTVWTYLCLLILLNLSSVKSLRSRMSNGPAAKTQDLEEKRNKDLQESFNPVRKEKKLSDQSGYPKSSLVIEKEILAEFVSKFPLQHMILYENSSTISGEKSGGVQHSQGGQRGRKLASHRGMVYVGGTNRLYRLDMEDLRLLEEENTGPVLDNPSCTEWFGKPTCSDGGSTEYTASLVDNVNKILVVDSQNNQLISCGSVFQGVCQRLNLINISDHTSSSRDQYFQGNTDYFLAANDARASTVAFTGPGPQGLPVLYVAATYTGSSWSTVRQTVPALSSRSLEGSRVFRLTYLDGLTGVGTFVKLRHEALEKLLIHYVQGFSHQGYSYFLTNQRESFTIRNPGSPPIISHNYISKIIQICQKDRGFYSYVEIPLTCRSKNNISYNLVKSVVIVKPAAVLSNVMGLDKDEHLMIGVFTLSETDTDKSAGSSAMCLFRMSKIREKFTENIKQCFGSSGGASGFGQKRMGDQFSDRMCVALGMQVNTSYCGEAEQNGPLVGTLGIEATPIVQYTHQELTAVQAITTSHHTVVILGTADGLIKKLLLEKEDRAREFDEIVVDEGSSISRHLLVNNNNTHLYVMTDNKIKRLSISNCSRYSTCDTCRGARNPFCGWCTLEKRCSLRQHCTDSTEDKRWLSYEDWECLHIPPQFINPTHIPFNTRLQVTVGVKSLPTLRGRYGYECVFGDNFSSTPAQVSPNEIRCLTPKLLPRQHLQQPNQDHINVTLYIRSNQTGVNFLDTQLTFYDCSRHLSCSSCNKAGWSCVWCLSNHKCMMKHDVISADDDDKNVDDDDDDHYNRCSSAHIITSSSACPQLRHVPETSPILLPAGVEREIRLSTLNLPPDYSISDTGTREGKRGGTYECVIHLMAPPIRVPAHWLSSTLLICLPHVYTYDAEEAMKTVSVEVLWSGRYLIDDSYGTTVTVYRCDLMGADCSSCVSLSESFDTSVYACVWCGDVCLHNHTCLSSSSASSSSSSSLSSAQPSRNVKCPVHQITQVSPLRGPSSGGTSITIKGTNLGRSVDQIRNAVKVVGKLCVIIPSQYIVSTQIVCRISRASVEGERGEVVVTLGGVSVKGLEEFVYQDPVISTISPLFGPRDGGTRVTILGKNLDSGGLILPMLEDLPCAPLDKSQNSTHIVCITPPVSISAKYQITVRFDDVSVATEVTFHYLDNPILISINPISAYHGGGRVITVQGERLNVVDRPSIHLNSNDQTYTSVCLIKTSTLLHCPSPPTNRRTGTRLQRSPAAADDVTEYSLSFTMDGVEPVRDLGRYYPHLPATFKVYPDPVYHKFEEGTRIYKGEALIITGKDLDVASGMDEVKVMIGKEVCKVNSMDSTTLYCTPPSYQPAPHSHSASKNKHDPLLPSVRVIVGNMEYYLGQLEYQKVDQAGFVSDYWIMGVAVGGGTLLSIIVIILVIYKRKNSRAERQFKKLQLQLDSLESNIRNECKQAFAELQTEVSDFTSDLNVIGIPVWDYRDFLCRVLFPNQPMHILFEPCDKKTGTVRGSLEGLSQFYQLLSSQHFLLIFIKTLEQQSAFTIKDKSTVASLLMVVFHSRLDYITLILKSLLLDLIEKSIERKHPKLMLRRTESVVEKLLSNWLAVCLHDHLRTKAAQPLFMLYKAIKHQTEKGPIDAVTLDARYSLSEDRLLREKIEPRPLLVYVTSAFNGYSAATACKMLDCDTITQAKEKALDAVYMNAPFSKRPGVADIDLEWQTGKKGCVVLRDEDNTSARVKGWKRLNTLSHYHLPDGASLTLRPNSATKQNGLLPHSNNGYSGTLNGSYATVTTPMLSHVETTQGSKLYHLVRHDDSQHLGRTQKVVSEIFLTRLLATKCTLQQYVDDLFVTILRVDPSLPPAIKYLFDFLDTAAHAHTIYDPHVLHTWKCNSLLLRFWVNIVKNPEFIFDVHKSAVVDSCLSVITQTFMDACSTHEHRLGKDSPSSKLLYAKDIPRYRQLVSRFYSDIQQMPPVTDQDMSRMLAEHPMFNAVQLNTEAALRELFVFARTYSFEIREALDEDAIGRKLELPRIFEEIVSNLSSRSFT